MNLKIIFLLNIFIISLLLNAPAIIQGKTPQLSKTASDTPIRITNDQNFPQYASSGNGTQNNPYVIENKLIANCSSSTEAIDIENTNVYVVINNITLENCPVIGTYHANHIYIHSIIGLSNIGFSYSNNITVENAYGYIGFGNCQALIINNNTILKMTGDGTNDNITIKNNIFELMTEYGPLATLTGMNMFIENNIFINYNSTVNWGLHVFSGTYGIIKNNFAIGFAIGFALFITSCSVINNTAENNNQIGILIVNDLAENPYANYSQADNIIDNNTAINNTIGMVVTTRTGYDGSGYYNVTVPFIYRHTTVKNNHIGLNLVTIARLKFVDTSIINNKIGVQLNNSFENYFQDNIMQNNEVNYTDYYTLGLRYNMTNYIVNGTGYILSVIRESTYSNTFVFSSNSTNGSASLDLTGLVFAFVSLLLVKKKRSH